MSCRMVGYVKVCKGIFFFLTCIFACINFDVHTFYSLVFNHIEFLIGA